ncbi:MAG: SGNH/GDSL hydrolase family protein [Microthrixaceae bacterium]
MRSREVTGATRGIAAFVAASAVLVMLPGCGSDRESVSYAALGDSYSSGEGTSSSDGDCGLSSSAYPELVARRLAENGILEGTEGPEVDGGVFVFDACSGAEIDDVEGQLDSLGEQRFDLVTLTVGGNDVGFLDTLVDCVGADDVVDAILDRDLAGVADRGCSFDDSEIEGRLAQLEGSLGALYGRIVQDHLTEDGTLLVLGYPQLFEDPDDWPDSEGESCDGFAADDVRTLRTAAADLNDTIRAATEVDERVVFVDQTAGFAGHGRCSAEPWINGFEIRPRLLASFHPDEDGHLSSAEATWQATGY